LVSKGASREDTYRITQTSAMSVWNDKSKNFKDELLNSEEVKKYLTKKEVEEVFDPGKMLKNVDYIFARSVEAN
ncbi:MAG TPA: adenylosuccinate lyase, partial [Ignavibacteriales bacterium]|nr:adenylosuccinate lyase [Ignavibacteriales bacterium]